MEPDGSCRINFEFSDFTKVESRECSIIDCVILLPSR